MGGRRAGARPGGRGCWVARARPYGRRCCLRDLNESQQDGVGRTRGTRERGGCGGTGKHTFSIALLVWASFHAFFPLLALGVDALLRDAILDTAQTGPGVVALLAGLLAVGAGVLDLASLGAGGLGGHETGSKGVHVHVPDGVDGHLWLEVGGVGIGEVIAVG